MTFLFHIFLLVFQILLFFSFLVVSFFVKLPVVPFHSWLPEAHVEAPTGIFLFFWQGFYLKQLVMGWFVFCIPMTSSALVLLQPWLFAWADFKYCLQFFYFCFKANWFKKNSSLRINSSYGICFTCIFFIIFFLVFLHQFFWWLRME